MSEIPDDADGAAKTVSTCREAMAYSFAEQFERWRRLMGSWRGERDERFRLAEVAWVSAMHQTTYSYAMASTTRALLQKAPVPAVVDALGVADLDGLLRLWQPWASEQSVLFVEGFGMVSPQDYTRVGRLLAIGQQ
ncbi:hypothetical protein ACIBG8_07510 [Nonomuraea sp. NPDC050556]|uniref:hypothetical protein n=1 Tax=Nonomuraea sp. NPDC050556 TaxID=3364369 RepID=UPI00379BA253